MTSSLRAGRLVDFYLNEQNKNGSIKSGWYIVTYDTRRAGVLARTDNRSGPFKTQSIANENFTDEMKASNMSIVRINKSGKLV